MLLPLTAVVPRTSAVTAGETSLVALMKPTAPARPKEKARPLASASALEIASTSTALFAFALLATAVSPMPADTALFERAVALPPLAPARPAAPEALAVETAVFLPWATTLIEDEPATPPRRSAVVPPPTIALLFERPMPIRPLAPKPVVLPVARLAASASTRTVPPAVRLLPAPTVASTTAEAVAEAAAPVPLSSALPAEALAVAVVSAPVGAAPSWLWRASTRMAPTASSVCAPVRANRVGLIVALASDAPMAAPPACLPIALAVVSLVDSICTVALPPTWVVPLPRLMPIVGVKLAVALLNWPLSRPPPAARAVLVTGWLATPSAFRSRPMVPLALVKLLVAEPSSVALDTAPPIAATRPKVSLSAEASTWLVRLRPMFRSRPAFSVTPLPELCRTL